MLTMIKGLSPGLTWYLKAKKYQRTFGHFSGLPKSQMMRSWARDVLNGLNIVTRIQGPVPLSGPGILVGNHISYLDIPLLCSEVPANFVAKKELESWPLLGQICAFLGTIMVDRQNPHARNQALKSIARAVKSEGELLTVFPSGTTCLGKEKPWKPGVFKLAQKEDIPLYPFRLKYSPERTAAFIDDDSFLPHLSRLSRSGPIRAFLEFSEPLLVTNPKEDLKTLHLWCQEFSGQATGSLPLPPSQDHQVVNHALPLGEF